MKPGFCTLPLLLAIGLPATAQTANTTQQEVDRYASSQYLWCDAKLLGQMWGEKTWEAKATIGRKLGWGNGRAVDTMLAQARAAALKDPRKRCTFHEAGYTYNDAVKLGNVWRMTASDAKATVEHKILMGLERNVQRLLGQ